MDPLKRPNIHDTVRYWLKVFARRVQIAKPVLQFRRLFLFLAAALVAFIVALVLEEINLPRETAQMGGIFVLAALLWVTEALPLFATALLVIGMEVILLANPGGWSFLGFENGDSPDYRIFLAPIADPIIILFLGGFLMAQAAIKEGVDKALASIVLRFFGGKPLFIMLGLMIITAFFSMWMSNTATTAMMITLVVPMIAQIPKDDHIRKGLVLSIPFAANIGGMGTPIASPPNAVAAGILIESGYPVSFLQWMLIAVPLLVILLIFTWGLLFMLFPSKTVNLELKPQDQKIGRDGWFVLLVILTTILLWLSSGWHGLPSSVVALVPAILFTATGLLGRRDFNSLEWHILFLIAGGLALGVGLRVTGLDTVLVGLIPAEGRFAFAALVLATVIFSTFMSNTAASNLLLPIGISFASASALGGSIVYQVAIGIALVASCAMALPVSTPPNAIAYANGVLETKDMALAGTVVGLVAAALVVLFGPVIINFWIGT